MMGETKRARRGEQRALCLLTVTVLAWGALSTRSRFGNRPMPRALAECAHVHAATDVSER